MLKTKIAIIDADLIGRKSQRFPNLACMKLSAYYKKLGNEVSLVVSYRDLFSKYIELPQDIDPDFDFSMLDDVTKKRYVRYYREQDIMFDKIIISKVFLDTPVPIQIQYLPITEYGGTGFFYDKAEQLPYDIEHIMPDYHLYDNWVKNQILNGVKPKKLEYYTDYSIGFTTRGCIRQCSFCVNKNYKQANLHSPINEFLDKDRKYICLLDDNVFACKDWKSIFEKLNNSGKRFQYKQGLDERLLTDEKCKILFNSKWIGDYIFAFDNIKDKELIESKLKLIRKHTNKVLKFYTFCGFNHDNPDYYPKEFWKQDIIDLFERIIILMKYNCIPYIMRYKDYEISPYKGIYINIAQWCNQPQFFNKLSYLEMCNKDNERKGGNSATKRYNDYFIEENSDVAEKYFNLRLKDVICLEYAKDCR